jgi:hypothetical protein
MCPYWSTDFLGNNGAIAQEGSIPWDFAVISSGTHGAQNGQANHPGIYRITSSTTTNSGGYVMTSVGCITPSGGEAAEMVFQIVNLTTATIRFGFHDSVNSTAPTDGIYFEIASTGVITGRTRNNSTESSTATLATLSITTWYRMRVEVADDYSGATFYVFDTNNNLLGSATLTTNLPTGGGTRNVGHGVVATKSGTAAEGIIDMDFMSMEFNEALTR